MMRFSGQVEIETHERMDVPSFVPPALQAPLWPLSQQNQNHHGGSSPIAGPSEEAKCGR